MFTEHEECPVICFNLVTCNHLTYVIIKNNKDYLQNEMGFILKNYSEAEREGETEIFSYLQSDEMILGNGEENYIYILKILNECENRNHLIARTLLDTYVF